MRRLVARKTFSNVDKFIDPAFKDPMFKEKEIKE
jgi:hypothetical protein